MLLEFLWFENTLRSRLAEVRKDSGIDICAMDEQHMVQGTKTGIQRSPAASNL